MQKHRKDYLLAAAKLCRKRNYDIVPLVYLNLILYCIPITPYKGSGRKWSEFLSALSLATIDQRPYRIDRKSLVAALRHHSERARTTSRLCMTGPRGSPRIKQNITHDRDDRPLTTSGRARLSLAMT